MRTRTTSYQPPPRRDSSPARPAQGVRSLGRTVFPPVATSNPSPLEAREAQSSQGILLALLLLCLASLALRWTGVEYLLPNYQHLDGLVVERQVEMYRHPRPGDPQDEGYRYYPHLAARLVALLPEPRDTLAAEHSLETELARARVPWSQFRRASALYSTLMILATWLLARRFVGERWALFAAALVGFSVLFCFYSAEVRPHGIASTANVCAVLASFALLSSGAWWSYLLAGLGCAAAVGSLHYGAFTLPCLLVAHVLARRREKRAWWKLALAFVPVLLAVRVFYPFWFQGAGQYLRAEKPGEFNLSGQPLKLDKFDGSGFPSILQTLWSYDPPLLVLGCTGIAVLLVLAIRARSLGPRREELLVGLAFALPYLLVTGLYAETWERFVLNLLPWLAIASAALMLLWQQRLRRRWLATAVALLLFAPLVLFDLRLASVRAAPSTVDLAARWVEANVQPETETIQALPYVDLPLFHSQRALDELQATPWLSRWMYFEAALVPREHGPRYDLRLPPAAKDPERARVVADPMAWLRERGSTWVLLAVDDTTPYLIRAREDLRRGAELVARFTPRAQDDGSNLLLAGRWLAGWSEPFSLLLLRVARMGPTLEIYRLRPR